MELSTEPASDGLEFLNSSGLQYRVWLSRPALEAIVAASTRAGRRETGGILIGRHGSDGWTVEVAEATPKPKGSSAGWFTFRRSNEGLKLLLADRWERGQHYVGEWHFHPGGAPMPSGLDDRAMERISHDNDYDCVEPVLVILGGRPAGKFEVSATIYPRGVKIPLQLT